MAAVHRKVTLEAVEDTKWRMIEVDNCEANAAKKWLEEYRRERKNKSTGEFGTEVLLRTREGIQ